MKNFLRTLGVLAALTIFACPAEAYTPVTPVAGGGTASTTKAGAISTLGFKFLDLSNSSLPTGGDDTAAINAVLVSAKAANVAVYAPCGTYKHAGVILVDSVRLFGDGTCSIFQSTDTTSPNPNLAINLVGTAPKLDHVNITTTWAGARQANLQSDAVWIGTLALTTLVTNFEVTDVTISGAAGAGIGPSYAEGGIISRNTISNTLADSITLQNSYGHTAHVTVANNVIKNSGDACISVNSYQVGHSNGEATPSSDIIAIGNICNTPVAVGMNVCGGNDIIFKGNIIESSGAEGIYSEAGTSFFCQAVNNVTLEGNIITSPNTGGGAIASLIVSGASGFLNTDTKVIGNTITNAKTGGIRFGTGTAVYVYNAQMLNNTINGAGESGASNQAVAINGANNTLISGNTISNWDDEGIWTPSSSLNTGYLKILNNHVNQVNLGAGSVYAYLLDNTGIDELDFIGNTQTNGSSTVTGCVYTSTATPNINAYANDCQNTTYVAGGGMKYHAIMQDGITAYFNPINDSTANQTTAGGSGALAGQTGSSASYGNTAFGFQAIGNGTLTTAAIQNTGFGRKAGQGLTQGANNTWVGYNSGFQNTTASFNTALGSGALQNNNTGANNTAIGYLSMQGGSTTNYANNTAVGVSTLTALSTAGNNNTAFGFSSCSNVTTGTDNTCIGYDADAPSATGTFQFNMDNSIAGTKAGGTNPRLCVVGEVCILGLLKTADFNATTDQAIVINAMTSGGAGYLSSVNHYKITEIFVANCSSNPTAAAGGFYTTTSKGGTIIGAITTTYTGCVSSITQQSLKAVTNMDTSIFTAATLYLSLTTAKGTAATGDVYIVGIPYN